MNRLKKFTQFEVTAPLLVVMASALSLGLVSGSWAMESEETHVTPNITKQVSSDEDLSAREGQGETQKPKDICKSLIQNNSDEDNDENKNNLALCLEQMNLDASEEEKNQDVGNASIKQKPGLKKMSPVILGKRRNKN